jgi:Recombination enhancement, RecA-dependent nuclease
MATKAEKDVYAKLARLGCILCKCNGIRETDDSPTEMHHIRRFGGKRKNAPVIPLCAYHHRLGDSSIHQLGHKGFIKYWGFSEEYLLERLNDSLQEKSG